MRRTIASGKIRVGVGGWTYEPWRGLFYPAKLQQRSELEFASRHLTSIEINGTYYGSQKRESFVRWREETPDGFVFSVKGPRFATNRRVLADAGESIDRFFASGVTELREKLGPCLWQMMVTKKFDADDFAAFLKLLPKSRDGIALRHAVELRHESFACPAAINLAREHEVAIVMASDSKFPQIADMTAPFVYLRVMGAALRPKQGYSNAALDVWAERANSFAKGKIPKGFKALANSSQPLKRDVYFYFIAGHKAHNPAAAMALIQRLG